MFVFVLNIHHPHSIQITCPGVYLCSRNRDVELTVSTLHTHHKSATMPPTFPLCVHQTFTVEQRTDKIDNGRTDSNRLTLASLHRYIADAPVTFTLWHCSRRLAHVTAKLTDLINGGKRAHIIMQPSNCFPGSIAPLLEVSASMELLTPCTCCGGQTAFNSIAETAVKSMRCVDREAARSCSMSSVDVEKCALPMRQRPVCHGRPTTATEATKCAANDQRCEAALLNVDFVCDRCQNACSARSGPLPPRPENPQSMVSDISLWLQAIHPASCAACVEYREYFGDVTAFL